MERVFFLNPDFRIRMRAMGGLFFITLIVVARCALWIILLKELGVFIDLIPNKHAFAVALASALRLLGYGCALAVLQVIQANYKLLYGWWWREALINESIARHHDIEDARLARARGPQSNLHADDDVVPNFAQTVQESTGVATRLYLETYDPMAYAILSVCGNLVALVGQDADFKLSFDVAPGVLVWGIVLACVVDLWCTKWLGKKIPTLKNGMRDVECSLRAVLEAGSEAEVTHKAYKLRVRELMKDLNGVNARLRWQQFSVSLWQGPYQALFEVLPWVILGLYVNFCSEVATIGMVSQTIGTICIIKNGA